MKRILVAGAALLAVVSGNAQNLSFGPTVGFGHGMLSDENFPGADREFHATYNAGVKLVYSFVSHWGVSADVRYASEGGTFQQGSNNSSESSFRFNYVRVPLQGIYFFEQLGDGVRPKVSLGPSVGFLVGGESKLREDGEVVQRADSKDLVDGFDFGLTGAVGVNFHLKGDKWINTDLSYYHGLTNIAETGTLRNRGIGVNVGLLFPIGTVKHSKK